MADKAITRRLHIYVNGKEVERTLTNLRKEYVKAKAQMNRAPIGSDEWKAAAKQVDRLGKELDYAKKEQLEFLDATKKTDKEVKESTESLEDYGQSLSNIFNGIRNGDFQSVKEGFEGISGGIKGATKAAWSFIATPVGAAIAVLTGVAIAAREWVAYNEAASKAIIATEQITGLTGQVADDARLRAQALAETFEGTSFEENIRTAKVLVEQFGIGFNEAFDTIEDGLIKGQGQNDEYFRSLKEYPTFFAQAGFSAQEFKNIVEAGYDLGIYDDKLPDALKEFDLSIREQTTATKDALLNAFGAPFTEELLSRVTKGEITTKEALSEVTKEAQRQGLTIQQNAQLTADLFRGAGEDAGGAIKLFEAMGVAAGKANEELSPLEQSTKELSLANLELAKAQDEALKSDNYLAFTRDLEIFWKRTKTLFYDGISFITDSFQGVQDFIVVSIVSMTTTFKSFPTIVRQGFKEIVEDAKAVIGSFTGLGDVLENLLNFNFSGAKEAAIDFKENFSKAFNETKQSAKGVVDELLEIRKQSAVAAQASLDAQRNAKANAVREDQDTITPLGNNTGGGSENDSEDKVDKEAQRRIEKEKAIREKVKESLDEYEKERELQEQLKKFDKEQRQEEEEILRLEEKFEKLREDAAGETELLAELEEEKLLQIQLIRDKYAEERLEKEKEAEKKRLEEKNKAQAKEFQQKKKFQEDLINSSIDFVGRESRLGQALLAYKGVLAAKESLLQLGIIKNKVIADTAKSTSDIAAGTAATASVGFPQNIPLLLGFAAQVAGVISAIKGAIGIGSEIKPPTVDVPSFALGGESGFGNLGLGKNSGGFVRGVVEEGEYTIPRFIRNDPEVPQVIDYLENKRQEKLTGTPSNTQSPSSSIDSEAMYVFANAVNRLVDEGIYAKNIWNTRELDKFDKEYNKLQKTKQSAKINS
ncbi:phage tail tape measure protein, TP901 family [Galbibacter marinus]|uniref:Phage tail tape measure protein, TP901 family n=1 Tax=Galbibacter marinus TaxID=555500 RepID=K2PUB8_9FLAO|nr:hypothetical protein [Galbibacter marinus]EKF56250.1 phage tail tape measure protein, TP901 family [Galbibacter marinus]